MRLPLGAARSKLKTIRDKTELKCAIISESHRSPQPRCPLRWRNFPVRSEKNIRCFTAVSMAAAGDAGVVDYWTSRFEFMSCAFADHTALGHCPGFACKRNTRLLCSARTPISRAGAEGGQGGALVL
jgi:hypothetical protein